jgi:predicted alpha/beta hydrolase family esterase
VCSSNDPYADAQRMRGTGRRLGQPRSSSAGPRGHLNADQSGLGDWPEGIALLQALANRAGLSLDATAG